MKGAEPLFIKGTRTGCLLLHGAGGGTAWDLKEFANALHMKTGMTVWLPTLKGFGTKPEDLYTITFADWIADARKGVKRLQQECDHIFVVGHSIGGLLALIIASEHKEIDAIVTWAAPIGLQNRLLPLLPILSRIPILRRVIPERVPSPASEELKEQGWVGYDWIPSSIGFAVLDGLKQLKKSLSKVTCPTFLIQGSIDEEVSNDSASKIYERIGANVKNVWLVEGAGHPIMNEREHKEELFARTIAFLENIQADTDTKAADFSRLQSMSERSGQ